MALPQIKIRVSADTRNAEAGLERVGDTAARTGSRLKGFGTRVDGASRRLSAGQSAVRNYGRGIQNAAFQVGDFAVQVGAGTQASRALAMQLPQLLGGFGILGAVAGAAVAILIPMKEAMGGLADNGEDLTKVFGTLAPVMRTVSNGFAAAGEAARDFAELTINNLDRIIVIGATATALFAGRWVASMVAARIATFSFVGSLIALRTALIRTGIGVAIVAAGELVFQFTRLVRAAGGFGEALGLLADLGKEAFGRLPIAWDAALSMMHARFMTFSTNTLQSLQDMVNSMVEGLNSSFSMDLPGMSLPGLLPNAVRRRMGLEGDNLQTQASNARDAAERNAAELSKPLESLEAIREVLRSLRDERLDLGSLLTGSDSAEDATGGGGGKSPFEEAIEQIERQRAALEGLRQAGRSTFAALGDFVSQFAGKNKAAAIAAIAIQKALSISQIIANAAAAKLRALAELGPIAGPPVAAKIGMFAQMQAGLVAATGLAQAGSALSGGGGGAGGLDGAATASAPMRQSQAAVIQLQGDIFGRDQIVRLINAINESVEDGATIRIA